MGFDFKSEKAQPKSSSAPAPDKKAEEYRERAKAERDRFKKATEGDIWCCFCFKDADDMAAFDAITGCSDRIAPGTVVDSAFASIMDRSKKRIGKVRDVPPSPSSFNPYSEVEYTGNLEVDCIAEAMALFKAFKEYKPKESYKNPFDSAYWRCFAFESADSCRKFVADFQLARFGDKYLDGSAFIRRLNR